MDKVIIGARCLACGAELSYVEPADPEQQKTVWRGIEMEWPKHLAKCGGRVERFRKVLP